MGYEKPTLFNPIGKAQTPSNVTRIARSLRRQCRDGTIQIIEYQSGVGTGTTLSDMLTGGAFGLGVAEVNSFRRWARKGCPADSDVEHKSRILLSVRQLCRRR